MANSPLTKEAIQDALNDFQDPETGRSIVALGQVHDISTADGKVDVTLGLTTYSVPLWDQTKDDLSGFLRLRFPDLADVRVEVAVHDRPAEKIGEIGLAAKSVIAFGSGKGGVGKSTIATLVAYGLSRTGCKVGLMDADVYGPSLPHLLGTNQQPVSMENKIRPVKVDQLTVMSMGFFVPSDEAVIWRGPMLHSAISQLRDTDWGDLDYLIIDMPPGTGDVAITLSQLIPLTGAVVVCTPQDVALLDATKAIAMFRKVNIEVVGMVENMSHFICPDCSSRHEIFGSGGAKRKASELGVPFLGEVPINIQMRVCGDEGKIGDSLDDENSRPHLEHLCRTLVSSLVDRRKEKPSMPSLSVLS